MENYLYFAEADVETGDGVTDSEALCVPASSYIGADPISATTTAFHFKNAMGDNAGTHKVTLTHTSAKNKEVIRALMSCVNAHPSKGGFIEVANANAAALTTGTIFSEAFGGAVTDVSIEDVEAGGITGSRDGTISTSYGSGMVGTTSGAVVPQYTRSYVGNTIITDVVVDLTGLTNQSDDGDVIGLASGGAGYFFRYVAAETGTIFKIEMSCLELPTAASNVGLDIDLFSSSNGARAYDFDISGATQVIAAGADMVLGDTLQNIADHGAVNDYYYLVTGATHTGASIHTGGRIKITFYGHI